MPKWRGIHDFGYCQEKRWKLLKDIIKGLIVEKVKFDICLLTGEKITNVDKIDFEKYNNAFVYNNTIYPYTAIKSISILGTSILNVI